MLKSITLRNVATYNAGGAIIEDLKPINLIVKVFVYCFKKIII